MGVSFLCSKVTFVSEKGRPTSEVRLWLSATHTGEYGIFVV